MMWSQEEFNIVGGASKRDITLARARRLERVVAELTTWATEGFTPNKTVYGYLSAKDEALAILESR